MSTVIVETNEDIFLSDVLLLKAKWAKVAKELQAAGLPSSAEKEYSKAFRILLHNFSKIENNE